MTSLATINPTSLMPMSAVDLRAHKNLIVQVQKAVMKPNVHYGIIPGTDKPTLYQQGADALLATFRIAPSFRIDDLSNGDHVRYRVTCIGSHQGTGVVLGEGIGECSSAEEKYAWRRAVCQPEFDGTPETHRRIKYGKKSRDNGGGFYTVDQVRTSASDVANTVLKMAAKRAKVAMCLNVTAASDMFTQDLEDLPRDDNDEGGGDDTKRREVKPPQSKSNGSRNGAPPPPPADDDAPRDGKATDGEKAFLRKKYGEVNLSLDEACTAKGVSMDTLTADGFLVLKEYLREAGTANA